MCSHNNISPFFVIPVIQMGCPPSPLKSDRKARLVVSEFHYVKFRNCAALQAAHLLVQV